MEKTCVPSAEEPGLRTMLIWLRRCSLCISAGNITTLSQLEPDIEIRISTAFNDSHSNPLVSIRKGHQHIDRKVCYFNLQFFWVLTGAKENKLMPTLPPSTCTDKLQEIQGSACVGCEPLWERELFSEHRTGTAAGTGMAASSCAGGLCPVQVSGVDRGGDCQHQGERCAEASQVHTAQSWHY